MSELRIHWGMSHLSFSLLDLSPSCSIAFTPTLADLGCSYSVLFDIYLSVPPCIFTAMQLTQAAKHSNVNLTKYCHCWTVTSVIIALNFAHIIQLRLHYLAPLDDVVGDGSAAVRVRGVPLQLDGLVRPPLDVRGALRRARFVCKYWRGLKNSLRKHS